MIRVVLDTNVLVSANLNDERLEAVVVALALNQKIRICVSATVLDEYERVLLYPKLKFVPKQVTAFMARLRSSNLSVRPVRSVSESSDEADNRFLECAEAASADYLVTGNKRHFPKRWKRAVVVNARELLGLIGSTLLD
jgi:putative PIN family toxin of toxin-antitoxin system